ncbi:putative nuclease HARBI1 [Rhipicephalus sanguineus]|uniref:putative nuclease HARBI1 n=1 Tax=Rhipicephalus sanguineus TaxID=34632 RepID=UPI001893DED6|nr:putative nuclease HARBI1 [Rhipicephalus sanguineus]
MLPLHPKDNERGHPVPPLLQLLIALRFYGAGTFQVVTGDLVNVSQASVSRINARISRMIADALFPQLVRLPNASEAAVVMEEVYAMARFPGVSGCIDCTHVPTKNPGGEDAEVFRNRKGYFSINVQIKTSSVPIIITACAALHNFGHLLREPVPPPPQSQVIHDSSSPATISSAPPPPAAMPLVPDTAGGFRMRERIVAQYFT